MAPSTPKKKAAAAAVKKKQSSSSYRDKFELSPNNQAKCRKCRRKIEKGTQRAGIETYSERYNKRIYQYYHARCLPESKKANLRLGGDAGSGGGATPEQAIAKQRREQSAAARLLQQRRALREHLKQLRLAFANRLRQPPFCIFHDTVLDDIVVKMPVNKRELMGIKGIAAKKYQSFGEPILRVVKHYRAHYYNDNSSTSGGAARAGTSTQKQPSSAAARGAASSAASRAAAARSITASTTTTSSDDDDDDVAAVAVLETLSCEDIVKNKFEHAAANGYVISID